jgi:hypothetical protein
MTLRPISATVGALALSVALVLGLATPASAGPILGPLHLPTCATIVPAPAFAAFGATPALTPAFTYGSTAPALTGIIAADRDVTCSWTGRGYLSTMSEVAISAGDYTTLRAYYLANGYTLSTAGTGTTPGSPADSVFWKITSRTSKTVYTIEVAFLSPDGWWLTVVDPGVGTAGSFTNEAVATLLSINPGRR